MADDHITDHPRLSNPEENPASLEEYSGATLPVPVEATLIPPAVLSPQAGSSPQEPPAKRSRQWNEIWEGLLRLGLGETALRAGTILASIALVLLVIWVMGNFYLNGDVEPKRGAVVAAPLPTETATVPPPPYNVSAAAKARNGIQRFAQVHTSRPTRSRAEIDQYEVQKGDTIFGIAERFGLQPQTILWGNFDTLADDPHRLQPGQKLNILPVDGVLYEWHAGDGLNGVSKFFGVTPEDIINWPGNGLNADEVGDLTNPKIEAGTKLFIPGGSRSFISWSAPLISRADPAKAKIFGPGYCGTIVDGYVGGGTFVWPTTEVWISGYDFTPGANHWGIDIAGLMNNPIYAADSGVIVYAGWNDWGYGNVLVIDHGNGWQTLYAHLNQMYVTCGASVSQGATIAAMGTTGRSTGPHLHFELMNASGVRVNPSDYLTK